MKSKLLNKIWLRSLAVVAVMTTAFAGQTWGQTYEELFTITSGDVVSNSGYTAYNTTVGERDFIITFGGNNKSVGTNSGNRSNCNLSKYSKYAVSPITTSSVASAFACATSISNVSKISYTFNGGSNQTNTNVYLLYSADNTTFSQVSLTSGTQGSAISSGAAFEFSEKTGYFALLFVATNASGNWRIDDVNVTFYKTSNGGSTPTLLESDLALTNAPISLSFDLSNREPQTINFTSSSTGAVTVSESEYVTTSVGGNTITVTPVKITPSPQTITVTQEADNTYNAGTASFTVTITGPLEITPNYTFWGKTAQFSGSTYSELSGSYGGVTLNWSRGNGSTYANQNAMRFYKDNTLTFIAPLNKVITRIVFELGNNVDDMTSAPEGYTSTNNTWEGSAEEVSFTRPSNASGYMTFTKITVVISDLPSIAAPTFSVPTGTYTRVQSVEITCADEEATIYYTTDGTNPSATNGTQYTSAITIDETTTLKAIAIKNGETSGITIATYTMNLPLTTIAAAKQLDDNTSFELDLTGAQIVYIDNAKKNIYVRDATGAIDLYNNRGFNTTLQTGDILSGIIAGTYTLYGNYIPEIKDISNISDLTSTSNSTVVATVINCTTEDINANICDLVKIENKTITGGSTSGYYIDDVQVYDNFGVGYSVTTGKNVDVSGIALRYNNNYEISPRFASDIVYLDDAETVSITAAGLATFSSTKALDFTGADAVEAYTATVSSTGQITYSRIYKVPANTGLVVRSTQGGAVNINVPELTGDADVIAANDLVAVSQTIEQLASTNEDGTTNYILNIVNDKLGFYKANNKKVAASKAYLKAGVDESRSFIGVDDMTGIESIAATVSDGQYYDLQGRRVAQPQKGLYIVNGKKVIIK